MLENALAELGWMIDTDKPAHGSVGAKPGGSKAIDVALEMIEPALTQCRVAQRSLVMEAHRCGWHWLSQIVTREGAYRDSVGLGAQEVTVLEQWKKVLGGQQCAKPEVGGDVGKLEGRVGRWGAHSRRSATSRITPHTRI